MQTIQLIQHRQRPAAIVVRGRAIMSDRVAPEDLPVVKAMCTYALEIEAGERRGPYSDADAEAYALRTQAVARQRPGDPRRRRRARNPRPSRRHRRPS